MVPGSALRAPSNVHEFPRERSSDADLVRAVAQGDRSALAAIWRRHAPAVRATLYGCLGPDHSVDDLTQEVFVSLMRTAAKLEDPTRLRSYLLAAAVRMARFERRTRGRRARWLALFHGESARRAEPHVEGRDALRALLSILDRLQPRTREAFVLRFVQSLAPPEVAEGLGVSLATAKREIANARERVLRHAADEPALRDYLEKITGATP